MENRDEMNRRIVSVRNLIINVVGSIAISIVVRSLLGLGSVSLILAVIWGIVTGIKLPIIAFKEAER